MPGRSRDWSLPRPLCAGNALRARAANHQQTRRWRENSQVTGFFLDASGTIIVRHATIPLGAKTLSDFRFSCRLDRVGVSQAGAADESGSPSTRSPRLNAKRLQNARQLCRQRRDKPIPVSRPHQLPGLDAPEHTGARTPRQQVMRDAIPPPVEKGELAPVLAADGSGLPSELWRGFTSETSKS